MKSIYISSLLLSFIFFLPSIAQSSEYADVIYTNGTIWTGNSIQPLASSIAIKNNNIVSVGLTDSIFAFKGPKTDVVDLNNSFVMPGFIDNHVHFFEGGSALASVNLRNARTPEEFSSLIESFSNKTKAGRWILNGNWDHENWGGTLPNKKWIDSFTTHTPLFVIRIDGHMALANSAALALAGITNKTIAPEGGEILLDKNGELTGILKGNALNLVLSIIPPPSKEEMLESFILAQQHALSLGITKIFAMTANETEISMLDNFRLAQKRNLMKIRAYVYMPIEHAEPLSKLIKNEGRGDEKLSWGGVKGFVDGSLGAATAWFHSPYQNKPNNHGAPLTSPDKLRDMMIFAASADLRVAIHAIGDKAIDNLIADYLLINKSNIESKRLRIEHFQHPSQKAINKLSQHKIIASAQPYHAIDDGRWAEESIGKKRIKTTYAFKSILESGAILTFGSDWPVAPLSPLKGIYAAVTRRTIDDANPNGWIPEQKISVEDALKAYTLSNAYAGFEEDKYGTIEKGKRADIIVLSSDPRNVSPNEIKNIKVLKTIIDGEVVYDSVKEH